MFRKMSLSPTPSGKIFHLRYPVRPDPPLNKSFSEPLKKKKKPEKQPEGNEPVYRDFVPLSVDRPPYETNGIIHPDTKNGLVNQWKHFNKSHQNGEEKKKKKKKRHSV